jgi:hypothetical protein
LSLLQAPLNLRGEVARRSRGLAAELLIQNAFQVRVLTQGLSRLTGSGVEAHQALVHLFAQHVHAERSLNAGDGSMRVLFLLNLRHQAANRFEVEVGQPPPLRNDPVFIVAGQKFSFIEIYGTLKVLKLALTACRASSGAQRVFKFGHIRREGGRVQLNREAVRPDDRAR